VKEREGSLHWCRVTECSPQITADLVFRRQIELLEELWGNGDASGSPDAVECCSRWVIFFQVLMAAHIAVVATIVIAIREIFLQGATAMANVGGGLEWTVVIHCRHFGGGEAELQLYGRVSMTCSSESARRDKEERKVLVDEDKMRAKVGRRGRI